MATDLVYDTVALFAAGLVEHGVTDVVISPGSRSTALALTLHAQPKLRTWIQLDERSAGFFALGQARRTGRPSVLVCTSGTAAANYFPAIIEAHHAGVPMIVCTADRPPESRDWGSHQTIDQVKIYGATTRWAADLAVAGEWSPTQGQFVAHRAVVSATGINPGPVHLNWPLREPLEPVGSVPVVETSGSAPPNLDDGSPDSPILGSPVSPGGGSAPGDGALGSPVSPGGGSAPGDGALGSPVSPGGGSAPGDGVLGSPVSPGGGSAPGDGVLGASVSPGGGSAPGDGVLGASVSPGGGSAPGDGVLGASVSPGEGNAPGDGVLGASVSPGGGSAPGEGNAPGRSAPLAALKSYERGVIIVGPDAAAGLEAQNEVVAAVMELSAATAWPVIGEPISGTRRARGDSVGTVIANADHILRHADIAAELAPDVVIRLGGTPTTKPLRLWLEAHRPTRMVLIDPANRWNDPSFVVTRHLAADPVAVLTEAAGAVRQGSAWCERWKELDLIVDRVVTDEIRRGPLLSALVTSVLADVLPDHSLVMASNSMPVRELDSFVRTDGPRIDFVGNRGASGIDGITSTASGLASQHDAPVVLYIGDIALLHDLGALFGVARSGLHLTVVCVDNNGGGIFSSLPIASRGDEVDFETLFRTPHGLNLAGFDGVGGVRISEVTSAVEFAEALRSACESETPGVDLLLIEVDPDIDLAQHQAITSAVKDAVS